MQDLATAIYDVLRVRVPAARPEISYTDLIALLPAKWHGLDPNGLMLRLALKEIVVACRKAQVPAIPAIVVNYHTEVPGAGYYEAAHPTEAHDAVLAMVAWAEEAKKVRLATYPATLP